MAVPPEAWETISFAPIPSLRHLTFAYDESLDRGLRIGEILAKDPPSEEPIPEGSDVQGGL